MKRTWKLEIFLLILAFTESTLVSNVRADNGPSQPLSGYSSDSGREDNSSEVPSVSGGAAMADFTTLMNLIENTIEPDSWLSSGGTSVMVPFPAGIRVDPKGRMVRKTITLVDDKQLEKLLGSAVRTEDVSRSKAWHTPSPLRMVSLRLLDQSLFDISRKRAILLPELIRVAGLIRVQYVLVDTAQEDVILAGPADGNQNGFFLEDLSVVVGLIDPQTEPFGCTIDPEHQNLLRAQEFVSSEKSQKLLSQSPAKFAKQLHQLVGSHQANVFGMNERCGTAVALLAADVRMKELGFGKSSLPLRLKCYFDFLEREANIPKQSLIRWWFDYSNQPISSNQSQNLFRLPDSCVHLVSEQQFLTRIGRQSTGKIDPAADAFAAEWNAHAGELRLHDPDFSRMCCVFELALALQLALDSAGLSDYRTWFPMLFGLGSTVKENANVPKWVDGLVASHQLTTARSNIAVVSGGVRINPGKMAARTNWRVSPLLSGSTVPRPPETTGKTHWWWD